jgi:membrane-associated phospholipid phosphatase
VRKPQAIRAAAALVFAAGTIAPPVRGRLKARKSTIQALAYAAPVGLHVAMRPSRLRAVAVCASHMWAYICAYESPNDDPEELRGRVHVSYPIAIDRVLGLGELPTVRLQRALARSDADGPRWRALDRVLVWAHWLWFLVPHGALAFILWRAPERFAPAAARVYAVFDIGAAGYWLIPTAPPWYAASLARCLPAGDHAGENIHALADSSRSVRRMMVEYGEGFWRQGWGPLYSLLSGNPLAAMPSLHCATSVAATLELAEVSAPAGAIAGAYTATLCFALVYLGEHYAADLIAGGALALAVRRGGTKLAPVCERALELIRQLEQAAQTDRRRRPIYYTN